MHTTPSQMRIAWFSLPKLYSCNDTGVCFPQAAKRLACLMPLRITNTTSRQVVCHANRLITDRAYHFDYRTDLTDALCEAVGIDLSREVMTKAQINKVMSVVKKPRI